MEFPQSGNMSNCFSFNTQLASIMEVLANAAVTEICKLVDDGYAVLQLEISRGQKENEALKRKMRELESRKEHGCEVKRAAPENQSLGNNPYAEFQVFDTQNEDTGAVARFSGSEVVVCHLEDREMKSADDCRSPVINNTNVQKKHKRGTKEEEPESVYIKEEMLEDDLEVKNEEDEVKITGDTIKTAGLKSDEEPAKHNSSRNGVWEASEQGSSLKEKMENEANGQLMEGKGHVGELGYLDAVPSHSTTAHEVQTLVYTYRSENLAICTEAQTFSSRDKSSLLSAVDAQYSEDKEREEFAVGNITVFPSHSYMMGEDTASKCNVPHVTGQVSGDDQMAMLSSIRSHRRGGTRGREFICTYCGKAVAGRRALQEHQRVHTGEKPFTCTQCGKSFSNSSGFRQHKRVHAGEKPYSCTQCEKSFAHSSTLTAHLRTHTGEKPFTCTQCGKGFYQSSALTVHLRTHTGEKPFTCTQCGKGFYQSSALTVHLRTHTGEKPFTCTQCGRGFYQSSTLTVHLRTHTGEKPFTCTQCGKGFYQSSALTVHLRSHSGERPFTCAQCGKGFYHSGALKVHLRIHTGEKPFTCTHCGRGFVSSGHLTSHQKVHFRTKQSI